MINIKDLNINNYIVNLEFSNLIYGLFARDKDLINEILLMVSGINKSKDNCFYNDENCYDNEIYFKNRIYMDFKNEYFETIKASQIAKGLKKKYSLDVDTLSLAKHLGILKIRGECTITSKYNLTKTGHSLVNASVAISTSKHLIINNPTVNLEKENDIAYIYNQFHQNSRISILGVDSLKKIGPYLEKVILFTDFSEVVILSALEYVFVIDNTYNVDFHKLFLSLDSTKLIVHGLSKEDLKFCDKHTIKYKKIPLYEIEAYIWKK